MSRKCFVCGKEPHVGMSVSHSHQKTKRKWLPNLQKVKIIVKGKPKRVYMCTKCLKKGAVEKVI